MLLSREQFSRWSRMLARYLFFPAVCVVVWGELRAVDQVFVPDANDKVLHFIAYFGLSGMATVALDGKRNVLYAMLALILLGGTLEIVQGMVGRDAEFLDEVANTFGVLLGAAVGYVWISLFRARRLAAGESRK
jgi:VanZ family protein